MKGLSVGRARAGEQVRHKVIIAELADRFGFHLPAAAVDQFGPPVFPQVENVFLFQPVLEQQASLCGGLVPGHPPSEDFAGKLIEEQVEVNIGPFLPRRQIGYIPTPALIRSAQRFAHRHQEMAVVVAAGTAGRHRAPGQQHPIDGGEGREEQALLPGGHRQDLVGEIHIHRASGHRD